MRMLVVSALALVAGCYDPTYEGLLCAPTAPQCPDGYGCVNNLCVVDRGICGDGVRSGAEACDDNNNNTETACPYGMATCVLCSADCQTPLSLTGKVCGDRMVEAGVEVCDDNNNLACGSCSADCQMNLQPTAAVGYLLGAANLSAANDGQTFSLLDGVRIDRLGFEIDTNGSVSLPNIRVDISVAAGGPVNGIITAVNASSIMIDASDSGGGNVRLVNQLLSGKGNQPIDTTIPAPFMVMGMSGGAGGDCPMGTGCRANGDCASNSCAAFVCQ